MKKFLFYLRVFVVIIVIVVLCTVIVKCDSKATLKELQEKGYNQHQIDSIMDRQSDDMWPVLLMG